ncbi:hypothetical protein R3W88_005471 [Solanum pinnatisectum]|uniref:LIM zinc-binding domain-containing protein n=1 Tax=Solanum pinnatisectum TaxID=50273 RepID=A0AAV9KCW3_9SOLN|nr:hypothetical protein R3W88_005471 [Solanum pinnatisectum]
MQVNANYIRYNIQVPNRFLMTPIVVEEEDINEFVDQDMSQYFKRSTSYVPSVMDIDNNENGDNDEENEACAICLLEYKDEDNTSTLQCGHEFHLFCRNCRNCFIFFCIKREQNIHIVILLKIDF